MEKIERTTDAEVVRQAMRHWATGVTVVTSAYEGQQHGMTVSSFTSVSLVPPLVLVSLEWGTRTAGLVRESGVFGVTILRSGQQEVSNRFAGRLTEVEDRFEGVETYTLTSAAPLIRGGLAAFDCRVVSTYEVGTHTLVIGEVVEAHIDDGDDPLIYYNRSYRNLGL